MDEQKQMDTTYSWFTNLKKSKGELSKISSSFCLAKWLQVSLHLHKGLTHSCHHPLAHKITKKDIADNPSGLHNTQQKMLERKSMLNGVQPKPCEYCWNIENANPEAISDRVMKSSSEWAFPYANQVIDSGLGEKINPRYLEVSFSNICNFKCSYCSADFSSKWQQEIENFGPYSTENGGSSSPNILEENNIYIDTFWEWWPELKKDLHVFRITGGEPLLSVNTWRILDDLEKNPVPHLQIAINTNLGVSTEIIRRLTDKLKKLLHKKKVADVRIFTSIDAIGSDAELIRHGLNSELFFKHLDFILKEIPTMRVVIMATYSALSIFTFTDLVKKILELRKLYVSKDRIQALGLSTSYLRYPEHLSVKILSDDMVKYPKESLQFMTEHYFDEINYPIGFTEYEVNAMKNLIEWFESSIDIEKKKFIQNRFVTFYKEHDQRRSTNSSDLVKKIKTWT